MAKQKRAATDDAAAASADPPGLKKSKGEAVNAVRLQKDFKATRADAEAQGKLWSVDLVNDDLQHWEIKLFEFDHESQLYKDLQRYKKSHGIDCSESLLLLILIIPNVFHSLIFPFQKVTFHMIFPDSYPLEAPFMMIKRPRINGGYIFNGGFCVDVLMQNWSPAIRPESLLLQSMSLSSLISLFSQLINNLPSVRQLLMEGHARIGQPGEYSEKEARAGFAMARDAHKNDPSFNK